MTDREWLELAAKAAAAAGMPVIQSEAGPQILERTCPDGTEFYRLWIPRDDDGDALRLAIKLRLDILVDGNDSPNAHVEVVANQPNVEAQPWAAEAMKFDQFAATRRAIVRAAAEIGKAM